MHSDYLPLSGQRQSCKDGLESDRGHIIFSHIISVRCVLTTSALHSVGVINTDEVTMTDDMMMDAQLAHRECIVTI